jgi:hypothetical protein
MNEPKTLTIMDACSAAFLITIGRRLIGMTDRCGFVFDSNCREDLARYQNGATVPAQDFAIECNSCIRMAKHQRAQQKQFAPALAVLSGQPPKLTSPAAI